MLNRRIIRIGILILLVLAALLLLRPWSSLKQDRGFRTLRTREGIDRIVLRSRSDSVVLKKEGEKWFLFGEEPVNRVALENLFFAAEKMSVTSLAGREDGKKGPPWKEAAFFRGERRVYTFGFRDLNERFQVRMAGKDNIYYVSLPGFPDLNLAKVYSLVPGNYRDHLLINLVPSEVKSVEVRRPGGESFRFEKDEHGVIRCFPVDEGTSLPYRPPDSLAVALLFSYFTGIVYEAASPYRVEEVLSDTVRFPWLGTVRVVAESGEEHRLRVFSYPQGPDAQPHMFKALVVHSNHPYALVVNFIYLDVLLRGTAHYFGEK